MYRFCKLPLTFDPARLRADLRGVVARTEWIPHFVTHNYEGDWSAIPLLSVGGRADHVISDPSAPPEAYRPTRMLEESPYFQEVLGAFPCPVTSARLLKLGSGSVIKEHRDLALTFEDGTVRLHVPILTSPLIEFVVDGERVVMKEGECWYIDATLPHRLANRSETERVHIVFDCLVNDWLQERFAESGFKPREKDPFEARGIRRQDLDAVIAALHAMGTESAERQARELETLREGAKILPD